MMILLVSSLIIVLVLIWLTVEYSLLIPSQKGLPILMYHKISNDFADGLSVPFDQFEKHLQFLIQNKYTPIHFSELESLIEKGKDLPGGTVILTFDDAYQDFTERALPLLVKYNIKATVFLPVGFIGKFNEWDNGSDPIMTSEQIIQIYSGGKIEFGIHSFSHKSYGNMTIGEMNTDLDRCFSTLTSYGIPYCPVLAYPYGSYPKNDTVKKNQMKELFREKGINFALRIGNRVNSWPLTDVFELKRIDIRGTDNYTTFRIKIRKGRKKLF